MVTSSGNVVSQKLVSYMTSSDEYDLKTKETIKKIINGMRKIDQDTVAGQKIKSEPHEAAPSPKKLKLDWKPDSSLPTGWLISTNEGHVSISTPKDDIFHSRIEAIEHMIKQQQSPVDIFKLWSELHLEGWHSDDQNLPSGWRRKVVAESGRYEYLSPLMEVITTSEEFLKHIESSSDYSEQDLKKARTWLENCK